ncbi:uncharacterized protein LOC134179315 [Corticium candelabrum]|uniref:uncharacterized protein LOC134179315 n=1 Tax=Corticium candelabrum TaxID=121492 RepID=UPI002E254623|nr:uncharacterized protein LOC134179315 [Corticium candelabrum]
MEFVALEICIVCIVCICDVNSRFVTIAFVEPRGKTVNEGVERIVEEKASLVRAVVVLDIPVVALVAFLDDAGIVVVGSCVKTSIVLGRKTIVLTDIDRVAIDTDEEAVVGNCVIPSDNKIGIDVELDRVESEADIVVVVGSCVLASAVVGCDAVVGTYVVACVVLDSDLETVVNTNCVLPSAVGGDTTVVATDVDCVVIEADVVGLLVVERSLVAATAVDVCTEDTRKQQDCSILYNTVWDFGKMLTYSDLTSRYLEL